MVEGSAYENNDSSCFQEKAKIVEGRYYMKYIYHNMITYWNTIRDMEEY